MLFIAFQSSQILFIAWCNWVKLFSRIIPTQKVCCFNRSWSVSVDLVQERPATGQQSETPVLVQQSASKHEDLTDQRVRRRSLHAAGREPSGCGSVFGVSRSRTYTRPWYIWAKVLWHLNVIVKISGLVIQTVKLYLNWSQSGT